MSSLIPPPTIYPFYPPPSGINLNPPLPSVHNYPSVLPPNTQPAPATSSARSPHINPSVVVIVVILSVVFILSGFLHLLARCLGRRVPPGAPQHSPVSALHGQLQHLFNLHDAGVEQAFIDTLPVFSYGSIRGLKDSADCAVCLNEFAEEDRLRLLPKCKHAFHIDCIDTWLLSNSTCPLCRRSLLPDPITGAPAAPPLSLEGTECSEHLSLEEQMMRDAHRNGSLHGSLHGSYRNSFRICEGDEEDEDSENEIQVELETPSPLVPTIRVTDSDGMQRVLTVELGKVTGKVKMDSRKITGARRGGRSYSMGSYEYIVDPSNLELMIAPTPFPGRPQNWAPSKPTHRSALSDSIPELASAGGTPANDDLFWASRGLYTPQTLSRVRELLTPSPGSSAFSPAFLDRYSTYSPNVDYGDRWLDVNPEREENYEEGCESLQSSHEEEAPERDNDLKKRSSSLSRLPEGKVSVSCYRRSLSETARLDEGAPSKGHVIWDVPAEYSGVQSSSESVKNVSHSARRFSLNWLMGRDKRVIFSASSPSPEVTAALDLDTRTPI